MNKQAPTPISNQPDEFDLYQIDIRISPMTIDEAGVAKSWPGVSISARVNPETLLDEVHRRNSAETLMDKLVDAMEERRNGVSLHMQPG